MAVCAELGHTRTVTYAVSNTVYWQLALGVVLVALVLAMPAGVAGTVAQLRARLARAS